MNELQNIPPRFKYYVLDYLDQNGKTEMFEIAFGLSDLPWSINELTEEKFWHLYQFIVNRDLDENAKQFKNETIRTYKEKIYERWSHLDELFNKTFPNQLYTTYDNDQPVGVNIIVKKLIREGYEVRDTEIQKFLKEFYDILVKGSRTVGSSSSFGDTLFVMVNSKESFKDAVERLLNLPKHKFEWEEDYLEILEHDTVELIEDISPEYLKGNKGTVVHVYPDKEAFEVEFSGAVILTRINQIKKVVE